MRTRILLTLLALVIGSTAAFGQQHPNVKKGFSVDNAYELGDIDSINSFNGNLVVQIPIGPSYKAGGQLSYAFTMTYNSKVWDYEGAGALSGNKPVMKVIPTRRSNAGFGWLLSFGRILDLDHPANKSGALVYESADGAEHRIHCTLHEDEQETYTCDENTTIKVNNPGMVQGYTRDGTYLRMRWISSNQAAIEFPDGSSHIFEDDPIVVNRSMRIIEMKDRFGNKVTIEYPNAATCSADRNTDLCWKITDSSSTDLQKRRVHWVRFSDPDADQPERNYQTHVQKVEIAQWNTSIRAEYIFQYDDLSTTRGCVPENFAIESRPGGEPRPPRLKQIQLPTGDAYKFDYNRTDTQCGSGGMKTLTLPTGGSILYEYQKYALPGNQCDANAVLDLTPGIKRRTLVDPARNNATYAWIYETDQEGNREEACKAAIGFPIATYIYPELKNTLTLPTGEKIARYFSVWPKQAASSGGFVRHEYGLPFTRRQKVSDTTGQEYFLSSETTDTDGKKITSYVAYEMDPKAKSHAYEPATWDRNRRVKATGTLYDGGKTSITRNEDFDGLGHYRKVTTGGNFDGANDRTTITEYNPGKKLPSGTLLPFEPTLPHEAEWILETYPRLSVAEGSRTLKTEFCFDGFTGFLEARRTLKGTASSSAASVNDVLAVFGQTSGNVTSEKFYGGDLTLATSATGCSPKSGESPRYELSHDYAFGVLKSSEHVGAGFLSVDIDIDPYTGMISRSRDSAGIYTDFQYDSLGRIKAAQPQPGHGARFTYDYKFSDNSQTVDVKAIGSDGSLTDRRFVRFDSLGRVFRSFEQMPGTDQPTANTWAFSQIDYDGQNRQKRVYQPEKIIAGDPSTSKTTPPYYTETTFDFLSRPKEIKPADGTDHRVTYTYVGIAVATETTRRGASNRDTSVKRTYDRFGRLHQVEQDAKSTTSDVLKGGRVTTKYTYDPADRLLTVDADSGAQARSFEYDGRGFLGKETHPESGNTVYDGYDARGHAGSRVNGGNTLKFTYDKAERLEKVTDQLGNVVKEFVFGKDADGNAQGKLLEAIRRNDTASVGRVDVTESYQYNAPAGQVSRRTTLVEHVDGGGDRSTIQQFDYAINSYDDLLLPKTISMPTCPGCSVPQEAVSSVTNTRTAGHLTSIGGFASLTYHPSGMVEEVVHETPEQPVDKYSAQFGQGRPTKVTFSPCGSDQPYFLPGPVVTKVDSTPGSCGVQVSWPAALICGGVSSIEYTVLKNDKPMTAADANCTSRLTFLDPDVKPNDRNTYTVIAEGPRTDGGTGGCHNGRTTKIESKPFLFNNCNYETFLSVDGVTASIGVPATFKARLSSGNGPLQDEELVFHINNSIIATRRTAANGEVVLQHTVDLPPGNYEIKVEYAGGVAPKATATANVAAICDSRSFSIFPTTFNVLAAGGPFGVLVNTSGHCTWTPVPAYTKPDPKAFLSVSPATPQQGNGGFTLNVEAGSESRSSSVGVGSQFVRVEQGNECTYHFDPEVSYVPGLTNVLTTVQVSAPEGCAWNVESSRDWLTFDGARNGSGPGEVTFRVTHNTSNGDKKRVAELIIVKNGKTYRGYVNQNAPPPVECPVLWTDIEGGSVKNGQNVTMRVYVKGTYLKYTWYRDGRKWKECEGDDCGNVTIGPGQDGYPSAGDSATFVVHVSNICDSVTSRTVTWSNAANSTCSVPKLANTTFGTNAWPSDANAAFPGALVGLAVFADNWPNPPGGLTYQWYQGIAGDKSDPIPHVVGRPDSADVRPFGTSFYWVEVTNTQCGAQQSRTSMVTVTGPPKRRSVGHSDFNNDNKADIVWRNTVSGNNEMWVSSGSNYTTSALPPNGNTGAQIQTVGDLNGDERSDLLWRDPKTGNNEVWLMRGTVRDGVVPVESRPGAGWVMGAVGDFDEDGNHDIVWHDDATGANEIWFQNGTNHDASWALPSNSGGLHGAGDFNLDGQPDLYFYDRSSGSSSIWLMSGAERNTVRSFAAGARAVSLRRQLKVASETTVALQSDPNLVPVMVADMNGDGWPDIVWRDTVTGANKVWKMLGTNVSETYEITPRPDLTWQPGGGGSTNGDQTGGGGPGQGVPSSITLTAQPATAGTAAAVTATLTSGTTPLAGRTVIFSLSSVEKTRLVTGTDGVAAAAISVAGLPAGTHTNALTAHFDGDATYAASTASTTLVITAIPAVVTWANPAPIGYGTPLSAVQLNATANAAGTFVYNPPAGTILGAGYRTLSVTFTPSDPANSPVTRETVVVVLKAASTVTWPKPVAIGYGVPLSGTQLNATSSVPGTFFYEPPAGTALPAGNGRSLTVTFEPDDPNFDVASAATTIDVEKGRQSVLWDDPAPITVLQALTAAQLNATIIASGSAPAGQVTYNPPLGTMLTAGVHALRVSVAATAEYEAASASVDLIVTRVHPMLQWAQPAAIVYGKALSAAELSATADVPGSFAYSHALGVVLDAGTHAMSVVFTPSDSRYEEATASISLEVAKAPQVITWNKPAAIVYGTPLSATQLNAQVQVVGPSAPGVLIYSPLPGTVLPAGLSRTLTVTADSTDNYTSATASVTIDVAKAAPVITWPAPATIVYGTALGAAQLNATSSVPGTFVYSLAAGTILNAGAGQPLSVQFTPSDPGNYESASAVNAITVTKAPQTLSWSAPAPIVYGTALSAVQLNATVSVVGPSPASALTYDPSAGTVLQAGNAQALTVRAAGTANYQPATLSVMLDVLKAKPVLAWSQPAPVVYRTALSATQLNATSNVPGEFVYAPPAGTVLDAGMQPLSAHFTPADTRNYEEGDVSVTLEIQQATPILTWPKPAGIVYGTPLGDAQLNATADVPGTFTYDPAAGTILNAGSAHTLSMQFTPADTRNFTNAATSVTIDVARAPQKLTWAAPAPIVYGTPLSAEQLNAQVTVVGPAAAGALVYTPAAGRVLDAGSHTLIVVAQETPNYESETLSVALEVRRAPLSLTVDPKSKLYGAPLSALTGVVTGVVNNDPITASYVTTATQQSAAGQYPIAGSLADPGNRLFNYDVTITPSALAILPAPLAIAANPASKQYSDPIPTLTATFTGFVLGETPAVLAGTLVIQAAAEPLSAPGTYPISIGGLTSPNYAITYPGSTLTVLPEDARVLITSPLVVSAAKTGATPVTITATVQDISATADAGGDSYPGDIRKATLTFIDRATQAVLCRPVIGLVSPTDARTGIATCTFTRDFGATLPASLTVGAVAGGYYTRDAAAEDVSVTALSQTPDQINGAGGLRIGSVAGSHAPDAGSDAKFQIQFQYDKNGEVKGKLTFTFFRTDGGTTRRYELSATAISSLAINRASPGGETAAIIGTGTLVDTSTREQVAVGVPLIITAADRRDNTKDQLGLTLLKTDGGIWLATGWNGVQTVEQPISEGQIQVEVKK